MKYTIIIILLIISQCNKRDADDILVSLPVVDLHLGEADIKNQGNYQAMAVSPKEISEVWNTVVDLLPNTYLDRYVSTFNILSDGPDEILAGVSSNDESNAKWSFEVDIEDYRTYRKDEDFRHTLIHEFGHILTLNNTQVEPSDLKWQEGDRYLTNEGLAKTDSYIQAYTDQFWKGDLLDEWDLIQRINNDYRKYEAIIAMYDGNKDQFWTDYAAESPEEDIAESWYYFVVNDIPTGSSIKDKKLVFFSQYEELMHIRNGIRSKLRLN